MNFFPTHEKFPVNLPLFFSLLFVNHFPTPSDTSFDIFCTFPTCLYFFHIILNRLHITFTYLKYSSYPTCSPYHCYWHEQNLFSNTMLAIHRLFFFIYSFFFIINLPRKLSQQYDCIYDHFLLLLTYLDSLCLPICHPCEKRTEKK